MSTPYLTFLKKLIIFTLIFAAGAWLLMQVVPAKWQTPVYPFIILFFFATSLILHRFLLQATQERFARFANRFMAITFLKMVFYMMVMLIYVFLINPADAVPFIMAFFISYAAFTAFEIIEVLRLGRTA